MLGIEVGCAVEQADKRRTLLPIGRGRLRSRMAHHCSDFITRSHATTPARRSTGPSLSKPTIVDGAPPGVCPPSSNRSTSGKATATPSADAAGGCPAVLALVAVTLKPNAPA